MRKPDRKPNHLEGQTSPYLLQHLYNPVDWYPWGSEAIEKARRENKPLLISIGYSACHWCHVMENESFEDEEVARLMNSNFVCIKVDREERPDIDHLYLNAVQLLTGHGGWPLNCFALPDGRPFWGGTYFTRNQWLGVLSSLDDVYKNRREEVEEQAGSITEGVAKSSIIEPMPAHEVYSAEDAQRVFKNIIKKADKVDGGKKGAPKFPMPGLSEFLLHYYHYTRNSEALDHVMLTLRKLSMGGIYDQIGGGFSRYSTDEFWKVPHFEKMLYDNAQLISLFSKAWKIEQDELFRQVVSDTISFVQRELSAPEGVFYSALDADSEGEEGKFYVWSEQQIDDILQEDSELIKKYYNVGDKGLWEEDNNILLRTKTDKEFARENNKGEEEWREILGRAREKLLEARSKRIRPGLDDKVLVSWNALMIKALADAYSAFGIQDHLEKAIKAADYILNRALQADGKLFRVIKKDKAGVDGFLEDYALFINCLIRLYEVSGKEVYLEKAHFLALYVVEQFESGESSLYPFTSQKAEQLVAQHYDFFDNVISSSNSVMAENLFLLANYYENAQWLGRSNSMLNDIKHHLLEYSSHFFNWGLLMLKQVYPSYSLAITGPQAMNNNRQINLEFHPELLCATSTDNSSKIPLLQNRFKKGQNWFYLCKMGHCKLPVQSFEEVKKQMEK